LVGWPAILSYFAQLNVSRENGTPLNRRIVLRWRSHHFFPLVPGARNAHARTPPFTTTHALTAWLLSSFDTKSLYRVGFVAKDVDSGMFPTPGMQQLVA
jgi:hypothetical protein